MFDSTYRPGTFWRCDRITHTLLASLPYGLLVRVSSNPENRNSKTSVYECECNKDNRNVTIIAIAVRSSKEKVLRQSVSVT